MDCGEVHSTIDLRIRKQVFLYAISLVITDHPTTFDNGSEWTHLVLETFANLGTRRKRGRDEGNDYDDWQLSKTFAYPWRRIDEEVLTPTIQTLVSNFQRRNNGPVQKPQAMDVGC